MNTVNSTVKSSTSWLNQNLLVWLSGFLLIFIPLMPKIPLADVLPGYIVRVRLEDFAILITTLIWGVQLLRHQVRLHPLVTKAILLYLAIGFLSSLSAIFITHTVPLVLLHVGKISLHFFRRVEYYSLFFIFYSAIRTPKQAKTLMVIITAVIIMVTGYGFGQKYLYWPVYSTMNREFSKGWRLYLTEHARVPSTFGGHYDAAAFTMVVITIMLALFLYTKSRWLKLFSGVGFLSGIWLLILTASRTSFIGYLVGVTVLFFLVSLKRSWKFALPRWAGVMALSLFVMLSFGDLSERYAQIFKLDKLKEQYGAFLFSPKVNNPVGKDINIKPEDLVSVKSDQPPVTQNPNNNTSNLPGDVYENIPDKQIYFDSNGETVVVETQRTYSDNAYKYGLSAAIRLDSTWPKAIAGFKTNILLGSGYSTLTKDSVGQFTEAESTDNDYLRALGETGLLGFLSFYGVIILVMYLAYRSLPQLTGEPLFFAFTLGFVAASVALLLNAVYIDVYESSKVAETYWALAGLTLALPLLKIPAKSKARQST
jgi:hypothetical protein